MIYTVFKNKKSIVLAICLHFTTCSNFFLDIHLVKKFEWIVLKRKNAYAFMIKVPYSDFKCSCKVFFKLYANYIYWSNFLSCLMLLNFSAITIDHRLTKKTITG